MTTRLNGDAIRWLETLDREGSLGRMSDGQLIEEFLERQGTTSEAAFEVLVRRYGPMVLSLCRVILRDDHDAADAFQATFVVLARRAATIRDCDHLAPWLGRVARRISRRHRDEALRRAARERRAHAERSRTAVAEPDSVSHETASVVRAEVDRLPEVDRSLLQMTYWQGKTYEEVAAVLSWPIGTVRSRLSRVRERLRGRLTRRGLAPELAVAGRATIIGEVYAAPPSEVLILQTARAATLTAGEMTASVQAGALPAAVAALVNAELAMITAISAKPIAVLVLLGGMATAGVVSQLQRDAGGGLPGPGIRRAEAPPTSPPAPPVDREAWARKLAGLNDANWRTAFALGQELAALPPDEGFALLEENWRKIAKVEARQQVLKAFDFAHHRRLVDVLDLGMHDPSPGVQQWALGYLGDLALRDFSDDFGAYEDWYQTNRNQPLTEVVTRSARRFATDSARSVKRDAAKRAQWLVRHSNLLTATPEARQAMGDSGFVRTLERWASGATIQSPRDEVDRVIGAVNALAQFKPGEEVLRRTVVPLLARENPPEVRSAAMQALASPENDWAIDLLLGVLGESLQEAGAARRTIAWAAAAALASFDNPRVIPTMIAAIEADNTYDTVYGVGYFGLGRLTAVEYDKSHDGAWWRRWWEKNRQRYPEVARALAIPEVAPRRPVAEQEPADPLADVADVPAQDLRAGGDVKKRYFLIGARDAKPPAAGHGLLIVLPGGDGSAEFQPFVRRLVKNALNDRWLVAEAVAPKWDENQFNRIVWPTSTSKYPAARFTTEDFIQAIVADVRAKKKIDPRRVVLFGWSSGGPACYAAALRKDSVVTGAFIAMSVFVPRQLPPVANAKGRAFYLLQSPQDQVTPLRHADAAEKALRAAGAKVRLERYDGGHGWRGSVWAMIGEGMTWLEQQTETP